VIRTLWVYSVVLVSTLFHGTVVLVASLFGVRGDLYSGFTQKWARSILRASAVPISVEGSENLRPGKPQIVVSNHVSGYDILALAAVLPRPFAFVGKKELDRIPFFGRAWVAAGHISIDRSDRQKAVATLQEAGRRIRDEGSTVIMFPEGTRSTTGQMLPFKKGAFALAVESGVPIVPTVIFGTDRIWQKGSSRVHPHPIIVRFGIPLEPGRRGERGLDLLAETTRKRMQQMLDEPADLARTAGRVSDPA
jgi:1-acyl-sn-glycerol-3-phosphate acyltransferase